MEHGTDLKNSGLRPFQEYFTYIEPIVNQRWAKTGVPGEKPPDLPVQNKYYHETWNKHFQHYGQRTPTITSPIFYKIMPRCKFRPS